jgi:hypothetical protein
VEVCEILSLRRFARVVETVTIVVVFMLFLPDGTGRKNFLALSIDDFSSRPHTYVEIHISSSWPMLQLIYIIVNLFKFHCITKIHKKHSSYAKTNKILLENL